MTKILCPVCKQTMEEKQKSFVCNQRHCFDKSRSGYLNLLPPNAKRTNAPGDNAEMILSRRKIMDLGYYEALISNILTFLPSFSFSLLDLGCGEGYISREIKKYRPDAEIYGMDISKEAVNISAKKDKSSFYFVGSMLDLPIQSHSLDVIVSAFAPINYEEAERVLKDNGMLIKITPSSDHLFDLKKYLYDIPYLNPEFNEDTKGFCLSSMLEVKSIFNAKGENIKDLVRMTPYYYKTDEERLQKLFSESVFSTNLSFDIRILQPSR